MLTELGRGVTDGRRSRGKAEGRGNHAGASDLGVREVHEHLVFHDLGLHQNLLPVQDGARGDVGLVELLEALVGAPGLHDLGDLGVDLLTQLGPLRVVGEPGVLQDVVEAQHLAHAGELAVVVGGDVDPLAVGALVDAEAAVDAFGPGVRVVLGLG